MKIQDVIDHISLFYDSPMSAMSDCLRGFIIAAPGFDLIAADFSNIEGRALAWLAGEEWKLEAFRAFDRGEGRDLYLIGAERILTVLGRPPEKPLTKKSPERQSHGKTPELACGYQGGKGAFDTMARNFGLKFTEAEVVAIVRGWREANPNIVQYWRDLEDAAVRAVKNPGQMFQAGRQPTRFKKAGSFLWAQLPSKRCLCYPYPQVVEVWNAKKGGDIRTIEEREAKEYEAAGWNVWSKDTLTYMGVDSLTKAWTRQKSYGGLLSENVTQAICRDLLASALMRLSQHGYDVVMHVHDEIVTEPAIGLGSVEEVERIMCASPSWAAGLPVAAEGWRGGRYRK